MRVIGGRWRGTRIPLVGGAALRPTADRTRETLFNWLQPRLPQARCLDLFAGSGALGFEAVSRGAASALLIDQDTAAVAALNALKDKLDADVVEVSRNDALTWLRRAPTPYDIVFVDPPFTLDCLPAVLECLLNGWLDANGCVYVEHAHDAFAAAPPWRVLREGRSRHAAFALLDLNATHTTDGAGAM